ncbi:DUF397 domain-containing protein [Streptomyces sp. NPDC005648]|uniref:DUF397 domain-containing protein n=1 Tax=Streptomyces sp. NPDC005648 TaxID=3157044 RepID=UPI0033B002B5
MPDFPDHGVTDGEGVMIKRKWQKSSRSASGCNCLEVAIFLNRINVRDSKCPSGLQLSFNVVAWRNFVRNVPSVDEAYA